MLARIRACMLWIIRRGGFWPAVIRAYSTPDSPRFQAVPCAQTLGRGAPPASQCVRCCTVLASIRPVSTPRLAAVRRDSRRRSLRRTSLQAPAASRLPSGMPSPAHSGEPLRSSSCSFRADWISVSRWSPRPFWIISSRNAVASMCVYRKTSSTCGASCPAESVTESSFAPLSGQFSAAGTQARSTKSPAAPTPHESRKGRTTRTQDHPTMGNAASFLHRQSAISRATCSK